jgi:DNA helicase-2/ATP-dependent DNA helicase PcrA
MQMACVDITKTLDLQPILTVLEMAPQRGGGWVYRRELHYALCSALRGVLTGNHATLYDAVWDVQNRRRHAGRRFGLRSVGSTLLVKGLEFDHVIVADTERLGRNDLYVALTRGAKSVTIISESNTLRAARPAPVPAMRGRTRRVERAVEDRQGMLL